MAFFNRGFDDGSLQITWYNASGKRCIYDVRDGRQEDVKVFIKKVWWEWDQVHKTWQMHCWLFLRQIHQWQAQKLARDFQRKSYHWGQSVGFGGGNCFSSGADFLIEVIRKDIREVFKRWRKRWRTVFAKDGVKVLKELFTSCARLNLGRLVGL